MAIADLPSPVHHRNYNSAGPAVITPQSQGKNTCDDVSANKSLFGNEQETPSTRSLVTRWSQALSAGVRDLARPGIPPWARRGQAGPGGNPVLPGHQREGCDTIPPA